MDNLDRAIINGLQGGLPLCERPYLEIAAQFGTSEDELLLRLQNMLDDGRLSRFGPLFNVERMGGSFVLCAMQVPTPSFEEVSAQICALPQVAHNYERNHRLNMWFVLATESPQEIADAVARIEETTGLAVYEFPKLEEFFVGLRFEV